MINLTADYNWLKIIHVISSIVLFGTGLGTAIYMLLVNFQKDVELIAKATAQVELFTWEKLDFVDTFKNAFGL